MKKTTLLLSFLICSTILLLSACKKDKKGPDNNSYPKNASIEYRYTLLSGNPTGIELSYTNENGGTEDIRNSTLPYSKKITRKVNANDAVLAGFLATGPGSIKVELLIDGKVVDSKTASVNTANAFTESTIYVWNQ
ncbi:MmpS family transport accessory protein [Pedobacter sp.]|uniref:MmpS family transport accessory protein n=1 Tax=Pedobacter sp. TaxID=1411316 RepID=UPI0031DB4A38